MRLSDLAPKIRLFAVALALCLVVGGLFVLFAHGGNGAVANDAEAVEAPATAANVPDEVAEVVLPQLPKPAAKDKEQKRFDRQDCNSDGVISQAEFLYLTRRNFDRRDLNGDGVLSFEEYAQTKIAEFPKLDTNGDGVLDRKEFAATAPKPRAAKKAECNCD